MTNSKSRRHEVSNGALSRDQNWIALKVNCEFWPAVSVGQFAVTLKTLLVVL